VIPAYNEEYRIGPVVRDALRYADEVLVIDDGSSDDTGMIAAKSGARVIRQSHQGYIAAVKRGFREASCEVIITMDADGEFNARDIPRLVQPILDNEADMVLGSRPYIERISERFLNWMTSLRASVSDSGTGFRAFRRQLALGLNLNGRCICGVSVLEPISLGARIIEIPVDLRYITKPRRVAWHHLPQMAIVLAWLIRLVRRARS
jgi:glycosyltransferase involved in cell wall biosynthesis